MRYASIDVMRDRDSGRVVEGDPDRPSETTEVWTFVRDRAGPWGAGWRLSAIQELAPA
jgi:predicted lipid-binding transport protein (Tim44 family)